MSPTLSLPFLPNFFSFLIQFQIFTFTGIMRQERRSRNIKPAVHQLHRIRFPSQVFWSFLFFLNKILLRCCGGWCKPQFDFMKVFHLTRSRNWTPCTPIMWRLQLPGGKLGDDTQHESSQQFCEYDNTITSSYSNDPRARVVFPFFSLAVGVKNIRLF